ncbi:ATP-binding protein [Pseudoduganella albidiflava]|uniref:histidine kinase n=1 Tax=Pseudoduganella albidiflava TaxID=321983 RepID=A0A411WWN9_9BURK|nr:ATP-binding protein [Pseudoduganella albidiflava]QBI01201.1 two-component sensor histidine kinase [Pseudoduganella albidiflava]GGY48915.1 two-component sensor histidine kinase [Pseudoduganella albidiflava]
MLGSESSLFRRLMLGFAGVIAVVTLVLLAYVVSDAKATQRTRTAIENTAHAREIMLHMLRIASDPAAIRADAAQLEATRKAMFANLGYGSRVRLRIWQHGTMLYNSAPQLPDVLPVFGSKAARIANSWECTSAKDGASGLLVDRCHEVDDEWMISLSGLNVLMSSTVFSLPLLLLPAWLIVGIGLKPLRTIAALIEQRDEFDLTNLPESTYRELAPLVGAINRLLNRARQRIEREHVFIADAAHELKTPLAAIQINAHVILSRSATDAQPAIAKAAQGLRDGVTRTTHMLHQLLAMERASIESDSGAMVETDLSAFLSERLALMVPMALARGIEIELDAAPGCLRRVHVESLGALVDNLVSNAIKYSPDGGTVSVRLEAEGSVHQLTVQDEGPGIDQKYRQRVFERFFRVPGQRQPGSGLGLAIAASAAARNHATIHLGPGAAGKGLRVTVGFAAQP